METRDEFVWPGSVMVGPVEYKVDYVADSVDVDSERRNASLVGQLDPLMYRIGVLVRRPPRQPHPADVQVTLVHEIMHGIFRGYPLLRECVSSDYQIEAFIDTLSTALVDTFTRCGLMNTPTSLPDTGDGSAE